MRDGGRLAAAIGVLADIETRHRPAKLALKGWGLDARYAGAKDRAFVSGLVMDALRRRRSLAWAMDDDGDRAGGSGRPGVHLGLAARADRRRPPRTTHGPGALSRMANARAWPLPFALARAPAPVRGDYPDWLDPHMARVFGEDRAEEGAALATRAPLDLRVNTLKTDRGRALKALAPFEPEASDLLPDAIRIPGARRQRARRRRWRPRRSSRRAGSKSRTSAASGPRPWSAISRDQQVLDLCAGGGGKTLALAAAMANTGQLYAYDSDARRLTDTVRRSQRAGVRNLQVRSPIHPDALAGSRGADGPRLRRCAVHRFWNLAAPSGHQVARDARSSWRAAWPSRTRCSATRRRSSEPGGRHRLCHLLPVRRGGRGPRRGVPAGANGLDRLTASQRLTPRTDGTDGFFAATLTREG